jgi:hypothetical protein
MAGNEAFVAGLKAKSHGTYSLFTVNTNMIIYSHSLFCPTEKLPPLTKKMLAQPEVFNGPFFIVHFTDDPVNGRIYDGYRIMLQDQDIRWCLGSEEAFKMWWLGGNEVMVQIPSASYSFYHDTAAEQKGKTAAGDVNPRIAQATNIARNSIKNNEDRYFKRYLLTLPSLVDDHNNLDNSVYSPGTENGKVRSKIVVLNSKFDVPADDGSGGIVQKQVTSSRCDIYWNIAIWEPTHRAETVASKGSNEQMEQLAKQLAGM